MSKAKNEELRERWLPVMKEIASFLGLAQTWMIWFKIRDLADRDTGGITSREHGYREAVITLNGRHLATCGDAEVEHIIVHELLHLTFAPLDDGVAAMVGKDGEVYRRYKAHVETVVDTISRHLMGLDIARKAHEVWQRRGEA